MGQVSPFGLAEKKHFAMGSVVFACEGPYVLLAAKRNGNRHIPLSAPCKQGTRHVLNGFASQGNIGGQNWESPYAA